MMNRSRSNCSRPNPPTELTCTSTASTHFATMFRSLKAYPTAARWFMVAGSLAALSLLAAPSPAGGKIGGSGHNALQPPVAGVQLA